jgi:hypothetical protein
MMGAVSGASHVVFRIAYARYGELRDDVSEQMARGGLLVRVQDASALTLDSPVAIELVLPDGTRLQDTGRVLQVFAGFGIAVSVSPVLVEQARRAANGFDPPNAGPSRHERIDVSAPGLRRVPVSSRTLDASTVVARRGPSASRTLDARTAVDARGTQERSPLEPRGTQTRAPLEPRGTQTRAPLELDAVRSPAVDGASRAEKIQRALHGTRDERNAILRDRDRTLHPFVLKNPQLNADDVATIAKNVQVTPDLLKQIGERKEWVQLPAIAVALARNPRTPPDLAVRALDHVPVEALRQMAKGVGVLPHITQAARKKILR